jgi:hypothetical protein
LSDVQIERWASTHHAHIAATADIYVKDISEDTVAAMQLLQKKLVEAELSQQFSNNRNSLISR